MSHQRDQEPPGGPGQPVVPSSRSLPEITVKALVMGVLLSALLAGANAYLGLFAGMTVSASIPAAVISMGLLRFFRRQNILENNIVQTSASAGESLSAGVIFTLPALLIMGEWAGFHYLETTLIAGFGGLLGVLFTIPLRRALIVDTPLRFPEGIATAEVLKAGDKGGGGGVADIAKGGAIGALFKLGATGVLLWKHVFQGAWQVGSSVFYVGTNLSPALVGVGYIVGLNIAVLVVLGGALNWLVAIPVVGGMQGLAEGLGPVDAAEELWSEQTRFIGVGAMVVGGLWALVSVRRSLAGGIRSGIEAYRRMRGGAQAPDRTERDTPMQWVGVALAVSVVPLFLIFYYFTGMVWISALMAVIMLIAGFLFSSVAGYMAGLVGSSNNPISGVTIATILTSALILLALLGAGSPVGAASAVIIGSVVACSAAIAGDNMQDLKAGRVVGATPYKQQIMQGVGVVSAALVIAPILALISEAYGIGGEPTELHPEPLAAPQATLMASVAQGVFEGGLPWAMVVTGMLVAVAVITGDQILAKRGSRFRMPVLAVAVGIYLPFHLAVPIFLGGLLSWAAGRAFRRRARSAGGVDDARLQEAKAAGEGRGLLFAAGLITGEALLGILLAIPIVTAGEPDVLAVFGRQEAAWPGAILLLVVILALYRVARVRPGGRQP